jgi:branched-subunit amino acid aminotransferase/4-amino-4-deoxychorismate lyase
MLDRDGYGLGADMQRLLAHARRMNMKLDAIDKKLDLIRRGQMTEQDAQHAIAQLDLIIKQVKRTVNPQE